MRPAADLAPASLASSSQSARRAQPQAAPGHAPAAVAAAGLTPGRAEPPARRRGPAPPQAPIGRPRPIKGEADAAGRVEAGPASRGLPRGGPIEGVVCGRGGALDVLSPKPLTRTQGREWGPGGGCDRRVVEQRCPRWWYCDFPLFCVSSEPSE